MSFPTVYLAGPILGRTHGEANEWRDDLRARLEDHGIQGISPLRCEPLIGERYSTEYPDPKFGTPRAIASKNMTDVRRCDMTLCYMPKGLTFSKGTLIELAWAHAFNKPTILVSDDPGTVNHPVVQSCAGWVLDNLDDAYDVIVGILGDYARL